MSALPRGLCPGCRASVALRNNGTTREHRSGIGTKPCAGAGKLAAATLESRVEQFVDSLTDAERAILARRLGGT